MDTKRLRRPSLELRQTVASFASLFLKGTSPKNDLVDVNYALRAFQSRKISGSTFARTLTSCIVTNKTSALSVSAEYLPNGFPTRASCTNALLEPYLTLFSPDPTLAETTSSSSSNNSTDEQRTHGPLTSATALTVYFVGGLLILVIGGIVTAVDIKRSRRQQQQ